MIFLLDLLEVVPLHGVGLVEEELLVGPHGRVDVALVAASLDVLLGLRNKYKNGIFRDHSSLISNLFLHIL